jgi:nitroreductase
MGHTRRAFIVDRTNTKRRNRASIVAWVSALCLIAITALMLTMNAYGLQMFVSTPWEHNCMGIVIAEREFDYQTHFAVVVPTKKNGPKRLVLPGYNASHVGCNCCWLRR